MTEWETTEKLRKIFTEHNLMLIDMNEYDGEKPKIKDWESRQVSYKWLGKVLDN